MLNLLFFFLRRNYVCRFVKGFYIRFCPELEHRERAGRSVLKDDLVVMKVSELLLALLSLFLSFLLFNKKIYFILIFIFLKKNMKEKVGLHVWQSGVFPYFFLYPSLTRLSLSASK